MAELNWGEYLVEITLNGQAFKVLHYTHMSGNAMMDEVKYLRRIYPRYEGYEINW